MRTKTMQSYPTHKKPRSLVLTVVSLFLVIIVSSITASADVLKLSPVGVAAIRPTGALIPTSDGGFVIRGRVTVPRDATGKLTLRDPYVYFMFEPMTGPNRYGPAKKMEWRWLTQRKMELDTIEELRGIVSNRDQRYGSWQAAFDALLKEIDTDDTIFHLRAKGGSAQSGGSGVTEFFEGSVSRDMLAGRPMTLEELQAYQRKLAAMPRGDPRGMRPTDTYMQTQTGGSAISQLLEAIARAEKYGEPEPGFLDAARAIAKFICEDLYPAPDSLSGPSRDKAMFIHNFVVESRMGLLGLLAPMYPNLLQMRLQQPSRFGDSAEAHFRVDGSYIPFDDVLAIDQFDVAKAAVPIAGELRAARDGDGGGDAVIEKMLVAASGRADFRAQDPSVRLPAELSPKIDQVGKLAFEKLLGLTKPHPHHRNSLLKAFGYNEDKLPEKAVGAASLMIAGTEAIVMTGVASASEVLTFVDAMWEMGIIYEAVYPPWAAYAESILRRIPDHSEPAARTLFQTYLATRIRQLKERVRLGTASQEEKLWNRRW